MASGLDKTLFNMRFTAKQLERESKKAEAKQKAEEKKSMECAKLGKREIAYVHMANAIREEKQAANFVRLASRIDAVAGRCVAGGAAAPRAAPIFA